MKYTPETYAAAWYQVLVDAPRDKRAALSHAMLSHMNARGHLSWIAQIVARMEQLEHERTGVEQVMVQTAHDIDQKTIMSAVFGVLGRQNINLRFMVDPALIGGMRIETQNNRWDLSIRGSLTELKKQLTQA